MTISECLSGHPTWDHPLIESHAADLITASITDRALILSLRGWISISFSVSLENTLNISLIGVLFGNTLSISIRWISMKLINYFYKIHRIRNTSGVSIRYTWTKTLKETQYVFLSVFLRGAHKEIPFVLLGYSWKDTLWVYLSVYKKIYFIYFLQKHR